MKVLITNDDGIFAPGLEVLVKKLAPFYDVYVVAPAEERSAIGHGITIWDPIKVREYSFPGVRNAWAVNGTPADCVKLAFFEFLAKEQCIVLSGINNGPNLGTDVLYSGTVSAAIEGAILGLPSIAFSLASFACDDFSAAADAALNLVEHLLSKEIKLPSHTLLNVNIPLAKREDIKGYKITRLGVREYENIFDKRYDPRGNIYYWMKGEVVAHGVSDENIDVVAVENNYISVTPLHFDLTNYNKMQLMKSWKIEEVKIR